MATRHRLVLTAGTPLALAFALTLPARPAHAHHWERRGRGGWNFGAVIADAIVGVAVGAQVFAPPVAVQVQTAPYVYYPPPPPPPPPPPVACCYMPPPAPVIVAAPT